MKRLARTALVTLGLALIGNVSGADVPPGFAETTIAGPWSDAVGITFEDNGRMYVWERTGLVWIKDPSENSPSLLLDISEEVGAWEDHGMLGFALDPNFRANGYIYLLYVVDRYYLLNFGTQGYNPNTNAYFDATIGRVTRYTVRSSDGFRSIDPASRFVLVGETKQTGMPICAATHGVGSLVFGEDGTLMVSTGDGASPAAVDQGGGNGTYAPQAITDGILKTKEDVGALRSQLVDSLDGKVLRIDPATGNGLPSNPYYDSANPRSARSRVWALGLRNPYRMSLRPNTGSHFAEEGNPGVMYLGHVGWNDLESLVVITGPKQNIGWPIFEGLSLTPGYDGNIANLDAPNPLYPASGCGQYFTFAQLLKEDTLAASGQPPFNNPCNATQKIPGFIPQFLHTRPVLDWNHNNVTTRTPTYSGSGVAQTANVGANGSPVSGAPFQGNCAIGGTWYTSTTNFPPGYQDRYFFADWGQQVIKTLTFDASNKPIALGDFAENAGFVVCITQHPIDGSLYYISYDYSGATIRQFTYAGNRTPVAVVSADHYFGATPQLIQFSSVGSSDPDGQSITYSWNFGDGSAVSTLPNPSHTFTAPVGVQTKFTVTLTVTDSGGLSAQAKVIVSLNNTPPNVSITNPVNGAPISANTTTTVNLTASVTDESPDNQLAYQWQVLLHHNDHNHGSPIDSNHTTSAILEPTGCDGINIYYYRILLTVTDPGGLSTTREVRLFPDCGPNTPPTITSIANQSIPQNTTTNALAFTVGDAETPALNLQVSGASSNTALVPVGGIVFGGSGANRTLTVTPNPGQTGTSTITVSVNDGPHDTSTSFLLTVNPVQTLTQTFNNTIPIAIPDQGAGAPYPSTINVTGMNPSITNATVTLKNLTHTWVSDIDVLLVGPNGQKVLLMSDAGNAFSANNITVTFSDAGSALLPSSGTFASGTYKPTDYAPTETFPAPAPAAPYATALSAFNGFGANGTWSLYVFDDGPGDQGSFAGGWSLTVTTVYTGPTPTPAPTATPGPTGTPTPIPTASPTPGPTGTPTPVPTPTPIPTPSPTPAPTATPAIGLVAAYGFDEGTGTTAADASGNGITGTLQGATWTTGGKYGNALSFNGSSSFVDLGNPTLLRLTGSMTWSAWVKAAANPADDGQIVSKSDNTSGWQFKTSPDTGPHTFGVGVSGAANSRAQRYSTTVRSLNTWYHVAGVYDAAARTLDIYVNGSRDNGTLVGAVPASQINSSVNVNIGTRSGGFFFNGIIDNVRIYNRALTPSEILADLSTPVGGSNPTPTPTVSPTATPTIAPTVTPTVAPTVTPTPAPTATATPTPTAAPTATASPTPPATASPTATPAATATPTATVASTPSPTATAVPTVTPTSTPSATPTATAAATATPTPLPTASPTPTVGPTPASTPTPTPAVGLVAAYSFNQGSGTTATDNSGHGLTGTIQGATWTTSGRYGNALSFNGSTSYVDLGNPTALRLTGSMTWSAWIKAAANPADDGQIVAKSDTASGWQLKTSPDTGPHTFGIAISSGTNARVQRYSNTVRLPNVWYHVAGVYDATARTLDIYVNGTRDNGTLLGTVPASQINSSVNVNIGRRTGGFYFNGVIDEVRIYNRPLNAAEIQADMTTPLPSN